MLSICQNFIVTNFTSCKPHIAQFRQVSIKSKMVRENWHKNLYDNKDYPDNYTDTTFLYELKRNINLRQRTFVDIFLSCGLLTCQVCVVVLFNLAFIYLYYNVIEPAIVLAACVVCTGLGYVVYILCYDQRVLRQDCILVVIYITFGYFISPVLKTLTETISTDTIYTTAVIAMLVHLVFYDYSSPSANVSQALSFNSACFGSLCLASRLSTSFHVFVLLTVTVSCFALLPPLTRAIHESYMSLVMFTSLTVVGIGYISLFAMYIYIGFLLLLNLLIPVLIVNWQKYKDNIHGPWDEAHLTDFSFATPKNSLKKDS